MGALLYDIMFATDASLNRVRSCMLANEGGGESKMNFKARYVVP